MHLVSLERSATSVLLTLIEFCGSKWLLVFQFALPLLAYLIYISAIIHFTVRRPDQARLFLLKTLISHLQFLSLFSYLSFSLPSVLTYFLHSITYLSSFLLSDFPLSCLSLFSPVYGKAIVGSLLLPSLSLLTVFLCKCYTKSWKLKSLVAVSSLLHYTIFISIQTLIPLLSCTQFDTTDYLRNGAYMLARNTSSNCLYLRSAFLPAYCPSATCSNNNPKLHPTRAISTLLPSLDLRTEMEVVGSVPLLIPRSAGFYGNSHCQL